MLNKFKSHSLRTHLLTLYVLLALISGILIPVVSAWVSVNGFHEYQLQRRQANFDALAESLTDLYSEDLRWDKKRVSDILRPAPQWMGMTIKLNDFNNQNIFTLSPIASFNRGRRNNNAQPVRASKPEVLNIELKFNNKLIGILNIEHRAPSARFEQAFANYMLKRMLIGAAIMIIAACGLGFLVAGSLSRPVVNALKLTKQISKGDYNLNSKIQETGIIEMDDLTRGVEDLSRALASQEKFRQRLMTDIAHELKTPLTASRTQLEAIADGVFPATPERLELCLNELDRLANLIQSVESLTRLEGDNLNIKLNKINLSEFLNQTLIS
ncbi:MAG: HAMP domain-containing histidine kinase, partial [Synergistaceae bacterium]|nr:HAMP domain-containing histidine kinase [Synergistaceae bacterium]